MWHVERHPWKLLNTGTGGSGWDVGTDDETLQYNWRYRSRWYLHRHLLSFRREQGEYMHENTSLRWVWCHTECHWRIVNKNSSTTQLACQASVWRRHYVSMAMIMMQAPGWVWSNGQCTVPFMPSYVTFWNRQVMAPGQCISILCLKTKTTLTNVCHRHIYLIAFVHVLSLFMIITIKCLSQ